jgi:hypothetical protein
LSARAWVCSFSFKQGALSCCCAASLPKKRNAFGTSDNREDCAHAHVYVMQ